MKPGRAGSRLGQIRACVEGHPVGLAQMDIYSWSPVSPPCFLCCSFLQWSTVVCIGSWECMHAFILFLKRQAPGETVALKLPRVGSGRSTVNTERICCLASSTGRPCFCLDCFATEISNRAVTLAKLPLVLLGQAGQTSFFPSSLFFFLLDVSICLLFVCLLVASAKKI